MRYTTSCEDLRLKRTAGLKTAEPYLQSRHHN
jgi:hypothetical protein